MEGYSVGPQDYIASNAFRVIDDYFILPFCLCIPLWQWQLLSAPAEGWGWGCFLYLLQSQSSIHSTSHGPNFILPTIHPLKVWGFRSRSSRFQVLPAVTIDETPERKVISGPGLQCPGLQGYIIANQRCISFLPLFLLLCMTDWGNSICLLLLFLYFNSGKKEKGLA